MAVKKRHQKVRMHHTTVFTCSLPCLSWSNCADKPMKQALHLLQLVQRRLHHGLLTMAVH